MYSHDNGSFTYLSQSFSDLSFPLLNVKAINYITQLYQYNIPESLVQITANPVCVCQGKVDYFTIYLPEIQL